MVPCEHSSSVATAALLTLLSVAVRETGESAMLGP